MADPRRCFIAMPLTTHPEDLDLYGGDIEHFIHVLDHLFAPAVERAGFEAVRPIMRGADLIHAEIVKNLELADLVLCDISRHNPNVFFELGIRTALDRPIALVRDSTTERLPFDTSGINTLQYDATLAPWKLEGEVEKLAAHIRASADRAAGSNPLWQYFGLTRRASTPPEGDDPIAAKLDLVLTELRGSKRDRESDDTHSSAENLLANFRWHARADETLKLVGDFPADAVAVIVDLQEIAAGVQVRVRPIEVDSQRRITLEVGGRLPEVVQTTMLDRAAKSGFGIRFLRTVK
ncbi:hypothetical protein [uncultured Cellulomonas sp.]|uniref:hypothetical protein n=1 Tax=uncultured Cellulomonas sp. TaxID=189682 RepID=UPI00261EF746|nr:hypothetical protein [uncultured Cellulomonas sp.]